MNKNLTVGKLIEILKKYPEDLSVWGFDEGGDYALTEHDVNYWSCNDDELGFWEAIIIG